MSLTTRTKVKPPANLSATYSAVGGFAVTLRWSPIESGAPRSYFVVYKDGNELATGITENSYRDTTVIEGEDCYYSVSTVNVNETEGVAVDANVVELPFFPVWETGWSLSLQQGLSSNVSGRASDPRGGALIFARNGGTAPATVTVSSSGVVSALASTAVGNYTVALVATGESGLEATYDLPLVVTSSISVPEAPINLLVSSASSSALNVSWSPSPTGAAVTDFDVEYSTSESGPFSVFPFSGIGVSTQITGLQPSTLYYVRVRGGNTAGEGPYTQSSGSTSSSTARAIYYDGSFSSAGVPSRTSLNGGGFVRCKYEPEGNVNSVYNNTSENTTASNLDCRVLTTETWNGETIRPRSGTHFMRQAIYYTKQYEVVNGGLDDGASPPLPASSLDKPRVMFDQSNSVYQFEWDQEVWLGFSIFLPSSHVGDIATKGNAGGTMVWVLNAGASFSQMILDRYCANGESVEKWWFNYQINASAVADLDEDGPSPKTQHIDLGVTSADEGKWTDFVIRYRLNPFSVATNASTVGGKNQTYQGNKGILQIWKGTGAVQSNGNRTMTRFANLVNTPIGGVPHATNKLQMSCRMYKYGWKKNPTTSTAPIYHGWDDIRWGFADATVAASKGQSRASISSDVSPSNEVLT